MGYLWCNRLNFWCSDTEEEEEEHEVAGCDGDCRSCEDSESIGQYGKE